MKKLVCLMMVALIGTVASATVIECGLVDVDYTIVGSTASISFVANAGLNLTNITFGSLTDKGSGGAFAADLGSGLAGVWNVKFTSAAEAYRADVFGMGDAGTLVLGIGTATAGAYATGTLVTFEYTNAVLGAGGSVTFDVLDDIDNGYLAQISYLVTGTADAPLMDSFTIPEPMTVALLGLGGLFIRRRK